MSKNSEDMGGSLDDLFFSDKSNSVEKDNIDLSNNQPPYQKKIQSEGIDKESVNTTISDNSLEVLFAEEAAEDYSDSSKPFSKNSRMEFRRKAAEEASLGKQEAVRQAESARIQSEYRVPEHLWGNVDRVLGIVVNDSDLQSVVNRFELTRDKEIDMLQRKALQEAVSPKLLDAKVSIQNPLDVKATFDLVYDELIGISVIGPLWRDESITEVMVDGWNQVTIEKGGLLYQTPIRFRDMRHAERVARDLASKVSDRQLSPVSPLLTAPLPGARITFCYGSVVSSGLSITLRKFPVLLGMDGLLKKGSLSLEMARFLQICVESRATVLVSGGTGTGKTTMINALSGFIPDTERVITIEDAFELNLANKNWVALQTKEKASGDDTVIISQDMLLVNTLRMRPDRIIVGEIREGNGATVMLRAATTGHDGTMTTIHANDPETALNERLVDMVREVNKAPDEVVKRAVSRAVNLVVQVTRENKKRYISSIAVVDRSCIKEGIIIPDEIFRGRMSKDGEILYEQVSKVRAETELGDKISQAGYGKEIWGE